MTKLSRGERLAHRAKRRRLKAERLQAEQQARRERQSHKAQNDHEADASGA
jgi:hypothetical protein